MTFFIENKSVKLMKIIEEGITYSEEIIGLDSNIIYKNLLVEKKELTEIREYIFVILGKLVKLVNELNRKSPKLRDDLLNMYIEEIANTFRKAIQAKHRSLDIREIIQIWSEVEFYQSFINKYKTVNVDKCFHNLRKIYSKLKGASKLVNETDIFSSKKMKAKKKLISRELCKVKLMQSCIE